jgi:hypothetical protein
MLRSAGGINGNLISFVGSVAASRNILVTIESVIKYAFLSLVASTVNSRGLGDHDRFWLYPD